MVRLVLTTEQRHPTEEIPSLGSSYSKTVNKSSPKVRAVVPQQVLVSHNAVRSESKGCKSHLNLGSQDRKVRLQGDLRKEVGVPTEDVLKEGEEEATHKH